MSIVKFIPHDEVYVRVRADPDVAHEISDKLSFKMPGAEFTPRYKIGAWDGMISVFSPYNPLLYKGLVRRAVKIAEESGNETEVDPLVFNTLDLTTPTSDIEEWAVENTPAGHEVRDYQVRALVESVRAGRKLILASTSSGKTSMIYRTGKWYKQLTGKPALMLVSRVNLLLQARDDFENYNDSCRVSVIRDDKRRFHKDDDFVVCTWQSAQHAPSEWFDGFGCVLCDEVHAWDSKVFKKIASSWGSIPYRFGFTGTLKGTKANRLVLEGIFGEPVTVSTNRERIEAGDVAVPKITMVRMIHTPETVKHVNSGRLVNGKKRALTYQDELVHLLGDKRRARVLVDLCRSLRGNTLVLFNRNEKFGEPMRDALETELGKTVHFVNGKVDGESRRAVQTAMESGDGVLTLASLGTFSEGMSTNNIQNVVFAYPMKGHLRLLQSVGRGLRLTEGKTVCRFYDLVDDCRRGRRENTLWKHAVIRCETYDAEGFEYKWLDVDLARVEPLESFAV